MTGLDYSAWSIAKEMTEHIETVKAIVVWNSWSRRYSPQMRENICRYVSSEDRRLLLTPEDTTCCTNHPVCFVVGSALLGLELVGGLL